MKTQELDITWMPDSDICHAAHPHANCTHMTIQSGFQALG